MTQHKDFGFRFLLTMTASLIFVGAATADYYVVTDLGAIEGPQSNAKNLDDSGRVVGVSTVASTDFHAAVWNGSVNDVGTIGADTQSIAYGINNAGDVAGVSYNYGDLQSHAFLWQSGVLTSLGDFSPHDINDAGVIAGHRTFFNAEKIWVDRACRWTNGLLEDLGSLGGRSSQAAAINTEGDIAGQAFLADNMTVRACLWLNGNAHDLGTLAGTATARSAGMDLNSNGQVVGWSDAASGPSHACLFQVNASGQVTSRTDLGALAGSASIAFGINDAGTIVGASDYRGFVWEAGVLDDLNDLILPGQGWTITRATAINSQGDIAADAMLDGFTHAVLLTRTACLKGDVNADGIIDALDIQAMSRVLINGGTSQEVCAGDMAPGYDGLVTIEDITVFVQCLLGGPCN